MCCLSTLTACSTTSSSGTSVRSITTSQPRSQLPTTVEHQSFPSLEEVRAASTFPVLAPDPHLLPSHLQLKEIEWQRSERGETVWLWYQGDGLTCTVQQIGFYQRPAVFQLQPAGSHEAVNLRGRTAYYETRSLLPASSETLHALGWEEQDLVMSVHGPCERTTVFRLAESLSLDPQ